MRRKDREVTEVATIKQIVAQCLVLRLAMTQADYPYIVPVNFGYEWSGENDLTLFIHGAKTGLKLALLAKNNKIGFEMDCGQQLLIDEKRQSYSYAYQSIIGTGEVLVLTDEEKKRAALQKIVTHYDPKKEVVIPNKALNATAVIAIKVNSLTAKVHTP
ncbi:pyridoxamine 5'-phosphate oxidase family protein [Enterococcus sp. SMC-9]|uniref:pyridoxamine 5'-phosphate oxidase family protein n=1 Tax=Enterococcus sp. SMC-9 TaxID=2862343 RepID=UPI001E304FD0|nr:pyridoxamine 5'-phosphate oxidase family protein [Enterococcus sp. SMC-9]MCD1023839.1 pyridoxamine 5'-phosphate oxidase family protein [Enterococcus sp. SMC-9]